MYFLFGSFVLYKVRIVRVLLVWCFLRSLPLFCSIGRSVGRPAGRSGDSTPFLFFIVMLSPSAFVNDLTFLLLHLVAAARSCRLVGRSLVPFKQVRLRFPDANRPATFSRLFSLLLFFLCSRCSLLYVVGIHKLFSSVFALVFFFTAAFARSVR